MALGTSLALDANALCAQFALCACQDCAAASFQRYSAPSQPRAVCVSSDALTACKRRRTRLYRAHNAHLISCAHPQRSLHVCAHAPCQSAHYGALLRMTAAIAPAKRNWGRQRIGQRQRYHSAYGHSAKDKALCQIQRIGDHRHCADSTLKRIPTMHSAN